MPLLLLLLFSMLESGKLLHVLINYTADCLYVHMSMLGNCLCLLRASKTQLTGVSNNAKKNVLDTAGCFFMLNISNLSC